MKTVSTILMFIFTSPALAKIANPPGVFAKDKLFCGSGNEVFALKTKDENYKCADYTGEKGQPKRVWKTRLAFKTGPENPDPKLEQDVQWCIVTSLTLEKKDIIATDCRGNKYRLTQRTGSMIKK